MCRMKLRQEAWKYEIYSRKIERSQVKQENEACEYDMESSVWLR